MSLERPYVPVNKIDCVDFVKAEDHNRQEAQLEALTALVPLTFNLPQVDLDSDTGIVIVHLDVPTGKKVCRVVMGVAQTEGSGPDANLIVRLEAGSQVAETSNDYEEFDFDPCVEGTLLFGSVQNLEATGDPKTCVGFIHLFLENA